MADWPKPSILALGTATFGMPYGVANPPKKPPDGAVENLLDKAWAGGITAFDTAAAYGEAEQRLGAWIKRRGVEPHITTKLASMAGVAEADLAEAVSEAIRSSQQRLGKAPTAYLTHDAADYLRPAIRNCLADARARGAIGAAGLSVYTEAEVFAALAAGPADAIQLPVSVLDQRVVRGGALAACAAARVAVFARSVFLQGALLMPPDRIPARLGALRVPLTELETLCAAAKTTRASIALRFVRDLPGVTSTIVGAYSEDQLAELIAAAKEPPLSADLRREIAEIAKRVPERVLDPRTWPKG